MCKNKKKGDRNQLFPTNKFRVFDSLGPPQTVVVVVVVDSCCYCRYTRPDGKIWPSSGGWRGLGVVGQGRPFVGSNSVRLSGMPAHCQCTGLSLSIYLSCCLSPRLFRLASTHLSLSLLRFLPLPHVALSKDSCSCGRGFGVSCLTVSTSFPTVWASSSSSSSPLSSS